MLYATLSAGQNHSEDIVLTQGILMSAPDPAYYLVWLPVLIQPWRWSTKPAPSNSAGCSSTSEESSPLPTRLRLPISPKLTNILLIATVSDAHSAAHTTTWVMEQACNMEAGRASQTCWMAGPLRVPNWLVNWVTRAASLRSQCTKVTQHSGFLPWLPTQTQTSPSSVEISSSEAVTPGLQKLTMLSSLT